MSVGYPTASDSEVQFVRIGDRSHRWTIIDGLLIRNGQGKKASRSAYFRCRCDCGNVRDVPVFSITRGTSHSCGCFQKEVVKKQNLTHGGSETRLYRTWRQIQTRCYNKNTICYPGYGGRGIRVCNEWRHDFAAFRSWAEASGYNENLSIDRIDVDGPYRPDNCRWVPLVEQANNKRNSVRLSAFGETMTVGQWSRDPRCRASAFAIYKRIEKGWNPEEAITTATARVHKLTPEEAAAIKRDIAAGMSNLDLARKHEIGRSTANAIRVGKLWSHA